MLAISATCNLTLVLGISTILLIFFLSQKFPISAIYFAILLCFHSDVSYLFCYFTFQPEVTYFSYLF